ncbi:hypothetical protein TRFO_37500 [Tritrichomonas foetus]|uniref:Uncharacterized protein n=1 Tax=Tritrichomonas foetus TaxID=1144522 RepID=A0A1J4JFZ8_9EUKA|nr:hypothetical protein TRFO_37500 [Tritrichomonas foetus]|eukprot:OHS96389.1 hypothetical protein TRFO_37500 [Tritrichomonas foetus]
MLLYKSLDDVVKPRFQEFLQKKSIIDNDIDEEDLLPQKISLFHSQLDQILEKLQCDDLTEISTAINILQNLKPIYKYNIIPIIVESGIFNAIIQHLDVLSPLIYELILSFLDCSLEDSILLLQNFLGNILMNGFFHEDDDICKNSVESIVKLMTKGHFIHALITSMGIIERIYQIFQSNSILTHQKNCAYFILFLNKYFENGPPIGLKNVLNIDEYNHYFAKFLENCKDKTIYNHEIYTDFIINGINLSKQQPIFNLLNQILSITGNTGYGLFDDADRNENIKFILTFLDTIYIIVSRNPLQYTLILDGIPFFDFLSNWIKYENDEINETLALIIQSMTYPTDMTIGSDLLEEICSFIFDLFNKIDIENEKLNEISLIFALYNLIEFDSENIIKFLKSDASMNKITQRMLNGSYRVSKAYSYLYLGILRKDVSVIEINRNMNKEIFDKIFKLMNKMKGEFCEFAISVFRKLFRNEMSRNKHNFRDFFTDIGGLDFLFEILDNDDPEFSDYIKYVEKIIDEFFS